MLEQLTLDAAAARAEHAALTALLREAGCEVLFHEPPPPDRTDAILTAIPTIASDACAIAPRMRKAELRGEDAALAAILRRLGVPILATHDGADRAEGGPTCLTRPILRGSG